MNISENQVASLNNEISRVTSSIQSKFQSRVEQCKSNTYSTNFENCMLSLRSSHRETI